jgi:tape measure domain-containing protein
MRQFGQALASGSLRGDELNSILEGTPALAQAVARGLGVTTGELRAMGAEGELTASKIITALQTQEAEVEEMSRTMNVTAGQAMVTFGNSLIGIVGKLDEASGASKGFANAVLDLSGALTRFSSGEFMDFFRDSKQTAEGFNNEISVTLSKVRDLQDARRRLDDDNPDDTVLFGFKLWDREEIDAELAGLNGQIEKYRQARDRLTALGNKAGAETPKGEAPVSFESSPPKEKTDTATKAIERQIQAIQLQASTLGKTADQIELYKLAQDGATGSQLRQAEAALSAVNAYEQQAEAIRLMNEQQEQTNLEASSIIESLRTEEEQIRESYERRRQIIMEATLLTEQEKNAAVLALKQEHDEQMVQANGSYWERYTAAAEENFANFNLLAESVMNNFSGQVGDAFESMIFDSQSLGDAVSSLAEGMARSIVNALGQMAAQWLAYQVVQLATGKATQASAAATIAANATAMSMVAGINAFASAAAIPIVGWAAAPGAMAAAMAVTGPMAAAASAAALSGMAHDGIDSIPSEGTWLLDKGERVVDRRTNSDLKDFLSDGEGKNSGSPNITVNMIEDASKAGTVEKAQNADGSWDVNAFVADLHGDGPASKAISQKFGIQGVGR